MKKTARLLLAAIAGLAVGCQSNRVVFVTQSSIGMDVSGTATLPNRVSLSFDRYEAAIVPRKTNGEAHSVFGGMEADMTWFSGHAIKQTFATGEAAKLATGGAEENLGSTSMKDKASLIFLTATTYGLNLSAGEQSMPANFLLGYRRTEAAVIPTPDPAQEVRSVYADIHINSTGKSNQVASDFSVDGVKFKQSFATGRAAVNLARNSDTARANLEAAAGVSVARDIMSRNHQRALWLADDARKELDRLTNQQLGAAIQAYQDAGIFGSARAADIRGIADAREQSSELKGEAEKIAAPNQLPSTELAKLEKLLGLLKQIK